jgi:DNA-binding CsgD family transcriptional regulator
LAIDDAQWLDAASSTVLAFALRRLRRERVAAVLVVRTSTPAPWLDDALLRQQAARLEVEGLGARAVGRILRERLGHVPSRFALQRLHVASGGNPFFAIELARAIDASGGSPRPGESLPLTTALADLLARRLATLPAETVRTLQAVALTARPTLDVLERVVEGDVWAALEPARSAEIVAVRDRRVVFTHPLYASALDSALSAGDRRALHRRVGAAVDDVEQRARHLALGTAGPDASIAASLDAAAAHALARGSPSAAAELFELAARLTQPSTPVEARSRLVAAAEQYQRTGAHEYVCELLAPVVESARGVQRAQALLLIAKCSDGPEKCLALNQEALREAAGDARLSGTIEVLEGFDYVFGGDLRTGHEHLRRAVDLLSGSGCAEEVAAIGGLLTIGMFAGEPLSPTLMGRARTVKRSLGGPPRWLDPDVVSGMCLAYMGRPDEGRLELEAFCRAAADHGDEFLYWQALRQLAHLEFAAARLDRAERLADEHGEISRQLGERDFAQYFEALAAAFRGRVEQARSVARDLLERSVRAVEPVFELMAVSILGFVDLSVGDAVAAWRWLEPLPARYDASGVLEVGWLPLVYANAVEAAIGVGELERAAQLTDRLEQRSRRLDSPSGLAGAARGAGLLAAESGATEEAAATFLRSIAEAERGGLPFERARSLMCLGVSQRRAKQRGAARRWLGEALEEFERLGTPLWAGRARAELARVAGRPRAGSRLTETENRVATLVAEGRSNKQVASALFVSVKAVEAHLTRIYPKLGVDSRTELVRLYAAERTARL